MSRIHRDPVFRIVRPKNVALQRAISSVILGGSIVAAAAMLWPSSSTSATTQVAQIRPIAEPPKAEPMTPAPEASTEPEDQVSMSLPTEVYSERPVVAVAHEDADTDFAKLAEDEMNAGELTKAYNALRKHIYRNEPTPEVLLNIGRLGRQIGEHAVAEQALLDAAALDPVNVDVQVELARTLLDVGQLDEARFHARQAIRLDADNAMAWNVAGRVAMQQSNWHRAEGALRRALELDPMNPMLHNNLGLLYIYTSRADDAVDSLETAVELFDDGAPYFTFNNLGLAHEMAGHLDEAREAFEQALIVNPSYARAKVNLDRVSTQLAKREEKKAFDTASGPDPKSASGEESLRE